MTSDSLLSGRPRAVALAIAAAAVGIGCGESAPPRPGPAHTADTDRSPRAMLRRGQTLVTDTWESLDRRAVLDVMLGSPTDQRSWQPLPGGATVLDPWQTALRLLVERQGLGGHAAVASAGPDGEFDTTDDLRWPKPQQ